MIRAYFISSLQYFSINLTSDVEKARKERQDNIDKEALNNKVLDNTNNVRGHL
jgi:hypothetical protein